MRRNLLILRSGKSISDRLLNWVIISASLQWLFYHCLALGESDVAKPMSY
jgi:hypothetical protein